MSQYNRIITPAMKRRNLVRNDMGERTRPTLSLFFSLFLSFFLPLSNRQIYFMRMGRQTLLNRSLCKNPVVRLRQKNSPLYGVLHQHNRALQHQHSLSRWDIEIGKGSPCRVFAVKRQPYQMYSHSPLKGVENRWPACLLHAISPTHIIMCHNNAHATPCWTSAFQPLWRLGRERQAGEGPSPVTTPTPGEGRPERV